MKYTVTLMIVKSITNFEQNGIFTFSIHILFVCWMEQGIKSNNLLQ